MNDVNKIKEYLEDRLRDAQNRNEHDTEFALSLVIEFIYELEESE